jgi:hypothetical protein
MLLPLSAQVRSLLGASTSQELPAQLVLKVYRERLALVLRVSKEPLVYRVQQELRVSLAQALKAYREPLVFKV